MFPEAENDFSCTYNSEFIQPLCSSNDALFLSHTHTHCAGWEKITLPFIIVLKQSAWFGCLLTCCFARVFLHAYVCFICSPSHISGHRRLQTAIFGRRTDSIPTRHYPIAFKPKRLNCGTRSHTVAVQMDGKLSGRNLSSNRPNRVHICVCICGRTFFRMKKFP